MRFIKINARKGTNLSKVINALIKKYQIPHVRESKYIVSLGFIPGTDTNVSNYTKLVDLDSNHYGSLHYFESTNRLYLDVTYDGLSLFEISMLK